MSWRRIPKKTSLPATLLVSPPGRWCSRTWPERSRNAGTWNACSRSTKLRSRGGSRDMPLITRPVVGQRGGRNSSERTLQNTENSPKNVFLIRLPMSPGPGDSPSLAAAPYYAPYYLGGRVDRGPAARHAPRGIVPDAPYERTNEGLSRGPGDRGRVDKEPCKEDVPDFRLSA